jgi:hypothetical protein
MLQAHAASLAADLCAVLCALRSNLKLEEARMNLCDIAITRAHLCDCVYCVCSNALSNECCSSRISVVLTAEVNGYEGGEEHRLVLVCIFYRVHTKHKPELYTTHHCTVQLCCLKSFKCLQAASRYFSATQCAAHEPTINAQFEASAACLMACVAAALVLQACTHSVSIVRT